jgi:hypothetical protein
VSVRERAAGQKPRYALIGRVLLGSALLMLLLAALFFTGALPGAERTRVLLAMVLGFAAALDALAGLFFLSRAS